MNTLLEIDELRSLARDAGFVDDSIVDLSPYLEIRRPRDRLVNLFLAVAGWLPLHRTPLGHLVGGSALQQCLFRGWIRYYLTVFRRTREAG